MDFYTTCPEPEHLPGREFTGATFRDYTGVAEPWQHVDWLGALSTPSAITDRVYTDSAAPFQVLWLSLHVSNFAGLQSGDTYRIVVDTTPPLVLGEPTVTVLNYTTIEVPSCMCSPGPSPLSSANFLCLCAFICADSYASSPPYSSGPSGSWGWYWAFPLPFGRPLEPARHLSSRLL